MKKLINIIFSFVLQDVITIRNHSNVKHTLGYTIFWLKHGLKVAGYKYEGVKYEIIVHAILGSRKR